MLSAREQFARSVAEIRLRDGYEVGWEQAGGVKRYTNQNQLGRDLAEFYRDEEDLPRVFNHISRSAFYVFELPVNGIKYAPEGSSHVLTLAPSEYVVLYGGESLGWQIVERSALDNYMLFEDLK